MGNILLVLAILSLVLLSGCVGVPTKNEISTKVDNHVDKLNCGVEAKKELAARFCESKGMEYEALRIGHEFSCYDTLEMRKVSFQFSNAQLDYINRICSV